MQNITGRSRPLGITIIAIILGIQGVLSIIAGILLLIVLLGFCWYALVASRRGDDTDAQLNELLIQEIAPDEPPLLSIGQKPQSLLGRSPSDEASAE